jgi:hypothetical protein
MPNYRVHYSEIKEVLKTRPHIPNKQERRIKINKNKGKKRANHEKI